jgi:hypothetical protein
MLISDITAKAVKRFDGIKMETAKAIHTDSNGARYFVDRDSRTQLDQAVVYVLEKDFAAVVITVVKNEDVRLIN